MKFDAQKGKGQPGKILDFAEARKRVDESVWEASVAEPTGKITLPDSPEVRFNNLQRTPVFQCADQALKNLEEKGFAQARYLRDGLYQAMLSVERLSENQPAMIRDLRAALCQSYLCRKEEEQTVSDEPARPGVPASPERMIHHMMGVAQSHLLRTLICLHCAEELLTEGEDMSAHLQSARTNLEDSLMSIIGGTRLVELLAKGAA